MTLRIVKRAGELLAWTAFAVSATFIMVVSYGAHIGFIR